ncbi:MAG: hypothetical protein BWK73_09135 [Thiothrix lacustris]|uniref:Uncharacterized protein n=1 Tax=Thiothrix lacustris TaxID=525917 RepID=A0A1Y1QVV4_9GAMM|nr:MAG: hypothetical protein BWK73_09135 [Thiothrix lacustris]
MDYARVGDTIECDVTLPVAGTIRTVLKTRDAAAYANDLLMDVSSGWRLVKDRQDLRGDVKENRSAVP